MTSADLSVRCPNQLHREDACDDDLTSVLDRLQGIISGTTYRRLLSAIDGASSNAYQRGLADGARRSHNDRATTDSQPA